MAGLLFANTNNTIRSTLTDPFTGAAIDPSDITITLTPPTGSPQTYTLSGAQVTKVSAGVYQLIFVPTVTGSWTWKLQGANNQGQDRGAFYVE